MKKTYIIPSVKVHNVKVSAIICTSPKASIGNGTTDTMEAREDRGGSMWNGGGNSVQW